MGVAETFEDFDQFYVEHFGKKIEKELEDKALAEEEAKEKTADKEEAEKTKE
jgi:hypothetical protein